MGEPVPVTVYILDKEYRVACPESERSALLASADLLNRRMKEIRDAGKVVGAERIAVMAALNLTHELLDVKSEGESTDQSVSTRLHALCERVDVALRETRHMEV